MEVNPLTLGAFCLEIFILEMSQISPDLPKKIAPYFMIFLLGLAQKSKFLDEKVTWFFRLFVFF